MWLRGSSIQRTSWCSGVVGLPIRAALEDRVFGLHIPDPSAYSPSLGIEGIINPIAAQFKQPNRDENRRNDDGSHSFRSAHSHQIQRAAEHDLR